MEYNKWYLFKKGRDPRQDTRRVRKYLFAEMKRNSCKRDLASIVVEYKENKIVPYLA